MKRASLLVKVAVVASSVLLVGGFVSYQAGALDWLTGSAESAGALDPIAYIVTTNDAGVIQVRPATEDEVARGHVIGIEVKTEAQRFYMSSSKSRVFSDVLRRPKGTEGRPVVIHDSAQPLIIFAAPSNIPSLPGSQTKGASK